VRAYGKLAHMANQLWQIGIWQTGVWQNVVFPDLPCYINSSGIFWIIKKAKLWFDFKVVNCLGTLHVIQKNNLDLIITLISSCEKKLESHKQDKNMLMTVLARTYWLYLD